MNDEAAVRREKLDALQKSGTNSYPSTVKRTANIGEAVNKFDEWQKQQKKITLCGRIMTTRGHGGLSFADLKDSSGKIQLLFKQDNLDDKQFEFFHDLIDPADFIEATGTLFQTKTGEKTLTVTEWKILDKALLPLPDKFHGLNDIELRYRKRELDLIANPEVREVFRKRSLIIRTLREVLDREGFEEVETPILQPIPGGASAKPFITHHNALDIDLYLRIAPELYLKRLIVGGYEKVYEIGRQFRNEGIDWSHNPEFTSLEFYWAFQDYHGLMDFTEKLLNEVIKKVNNNNPIVYFRDQQIDFTPPWPRKKFKSAVKDACGIDITTVGENELKAAMKDMGIKMDYAKANLGNLYDELYKETVRKTQVRPLFVYDYPMEMEPLAKRCEDDPKFVQRFQLLAGGLELLKAYSELNDPIDQLARFKKQQELRESGDEEAHMIDMSFIEALEHGLPPTAGWGMGIDRLTMMLTDEPSVKDVILFPTLRPENIDNHTF
ncbi:MAG: lysine--tRNA ligase [Patescibacteria group bacterium]